MTSYIGATDTTIAFLQKLRKQDISKAVTSPLSLRFTAATAANLSMSYSIDPSKSPGRCYVEMPSLFYFYETIQGYEDISGTHSEDSINNFQVRNFFFSDICNLLISHPYFTQGRLHWGQYITPTFTSLQYKPKDAEFYASIESFRAVAEKFDPEHMFANSFLNKVIWLTGS
jgi:hypothetical protein